jgi:dolichyl-phosphate-mannose-protein mannosyltransferase
MFKLDFSIRDIYDRLFLILLGFDIILRTAWLDQPKGSFIFDETFYVNAARVIIGQSQQYYQDAPLGLDPNSYHPPLAKLLIALSMYVFGDNWLGWRLPSVAFGSMAVLVFYQFMKRTANRETSLIAVFLFSFDNLIFGLSRIAMLDIFALTFMLLGFYWYYSGRPYLSALGMALSTLSKIPGASGVVVVAIVECVRSSRDLHAHRPLGRLVRWLGKYWAVYASSFLLTLLVLDYFWVGLGNLLIPLTPVRYLLLASYYSTSSCRVGLIGSCPWQWLIDQLPIQLSISWFNLTLAMNPAILLFAIPAISYSGYAYVRRNSDRGLFSLVWFAATYLPYFPVAFFGNRATFIYYFLLTMPSVCAAVAYAIADGKVPRPLILVYLCIVLFFFFSMFHFGTTS